MSTIEQVRPVCGERESGGGIANWWSNSRTFLTEVRNEMRRVTWPSRKEVYATTMVVIVTSAFFGLYLWVFDLAINWGGELGVPTLWCGIRPGRLTKNWYIVHTYSGFEGKVKECLRQRADAMGWATSSTRSSSRPRRSSRSRTARSASRRAFFPGYVLVRMEMSDTAWHVVKNTPKVTGFVGTGNKPVPLTVAEVDRIINQVAVAGTSRSPSSISTRARRFASPTARSATSPARSKRSTKTVRR